MDSWLIDGKEYKHIKNKNNTYSLVDEEGVVLLIFDTDYRVYKYPEMEKVGHINYEGSYLVFVPVEGKVVKPYRLEINPDNIIHFHYEIACWWLKQNSMRGC